MGVKDPEWAVESERWLYKVSIHAQKSKPSSNNNHHHTHHNVNAHISATCNRSLQDFLWLELMLRTEFNGALLIPVISVMLRHASLENIVANGSSSNVKVDPNLLSNWLSDVLNGVRGQGEWIMRHSKIDLMESEAMETFIYRNTDPLPEPEADTLRRNNAGFWSDSSVHGGSSTRGSSTMSPDSILRSLLAKPFACFGGEMNQDINILQNNGDDVSNTPLFCNPRARRDLSLSSPHRSPPSSDLQMHSDVLEAHRLVLRSRRFTARIALQGLQNLLQLEGVRSTAWKRFAISLSSLYAFEKDVAKAKVGEKSAFNKDKIPKNDDNSPKVNEMEDGLRRMARQKMDRYAPQLNVLLNMLQGYAGDLAMIVPSFDEYMDAIAKIMSPRTRARGAKKVLFGPRGLTLLGENGEEMDWKAVKELATQKLEGVKNKGSLLACNANDGTLMMATKSATTNGNDHTPLTDAEMEALESRLMFHELIFKDHLKGMIRVTPIRMARMAWKYFKMEAGQANLLYTSCEPLLTALDELNPREAGQDHEDYDAEHNLQEDEYELNLVEHMLEIDSLSSSSSKYANDGSSDASQSEHDDDSRSDDDDNQYMEHLREKAMLHVEERVGRWDAHVALSIMEAAGIEDAEVRVEETTRDLRLVRKYAIGLRSCLTRCREALATLYRDPGAAVADKRHNDNESINSVENPELMLRDARLEFFESLICVLGGAHGDDQRGTPTQSPSIGVLASEGIDTIDRAGWLTGVQRRQNSTSGLIARCKCGMIAQKYFKLRDAQEGQLLMKLSQLLRNYEKRVERIESFVYMHCVGIQLEKHFSKTRAQAVAGEYLCFYYISREYFSVFIITDPFRLTKSVMLHKTCSMGEED